MHQQELYDSEEHKIEDAEHVESVVSYNYLQLPRQTTDKDMSELGKEVEDESNQVIDVIYKGERYEYDFSKLKNMSTMPRCIKRSMLLEHLEKVHAEFDEEEREYTNQLKSSSTLRDAVNHENQSQKLCKAKDRLRRKLQLKNPMKKLK